MGTTGTTGTPGLQANHEEWNTQTWHGRWADNGGTVGLDWIGRGVAAHGFGIGLDRVMGFSAVSTAATAQFATPKVVGYWLFGIAGMAFGAVALGGVTRLTESGLSMVDWKLFGRPPPADEAAWEEELRKYSESPEFKYKNSQITMNEFKFIWYMEYGHRMWGRAIGACYYLPAAVMWAKGYFDKAMKRRIVVMGALLACQGLLGWYMVKSGLDHKNFEGPSDVPRVSQYRLASHLSAAMVLYSFLFWNALSVLTPAVKEGVAKFTPQVAKFRGMAMGAKALVFLTAVSGAFVAGLDAGLVYNSFPLMAGRIIPDDILALSPALSNFTENPTTVQFDHRILGTTTLAFITALALKSRGLPLSPRAKTAVIALTTMGWMQVGLGITTLLLYVPVPIAALHQSGALLTLTSALWLSHELKLMKALKYVPK
ncbi:hypothetical protein TCAL_03480 [Tigriopus californicus]|uniref:Cytochrome c oxidase assembly protein COX15-like protein n=1 Tax=Tigriopus californicus TaxID=6832 RepID=A0A553NNX8_TIGCA|nr:hypothetical protein TCAL_03480 [Tigriopus californicus]